MGSVLCPLCNVSKTLWLFQKNGYELFCCSLCDIAFVSPIPSQQELLSLYDLDYFKGDVSKFGYVDYANEERFQRKNFQERIQIFQRYFRQGRILDVGCATGSFLTSLNHEWKKYGVEISKELIEQYPVNPDISLWRGDFLDYPEEEIFHVITLWDLLDHVPKPDAVIEKVQRLLVPEGILILNVGDRSSVFARVMGRRWYLYIPPTHLFYFTRDSLVRFLERHGFKVLEEKHEWKWVPLSLCFYRLSYIVNGKWGWRLYRWIEKSPLKDWSVRYNFGDVLTIYARKV
jgi:2-polyprenyl-3-methyl-5-hydroxy-6-metoxy-1,4-benzoquinol methylase